MYFRFIPASHATIVSCLLIASTSVCDAQSGPTRRYYPLSQNSRIGQSAEWNLRLQRTDAASQPVRINLPKGGNVAILDPQSGSFQSASLPAQFGLMVGSTYRIRVSDLPDHPGVVLYPLIEVMDRLHPPPGEADNFPIPFSITRHDVDEALSGQLVTKVVYLEQPQLAARRNPQNPDNETSISNTRNLIQEADAMGRPILIVRIGGRQPRAGNEASLPIGVSGPVAPSYPTRLPQRENTNDAEDRAEAEEPRTEGPAISGPEI